MSWIFSVVRVLHILSCLFLILVVLLQAGKGAGIGSAFGGASSAVFGGRGAGGFISKVTWVVAGLFMVTSVSLAWRSTQRGSSLLKKKSKPVSPEKLLLAKTGEGTGDATEPKEEAPEARPDVKGTGDASPAVRETGQTGDATGDKAKEPGTETPEETTETKDDTVKSGEGRDLGKKTGSRNTQAGQGGTDTTAPRQPRAARELRTTPPTRPRSRPTLEGMKSTTRQRPAVRKTTRPARPARPRAATRPAGMGAATPR